MGEEVALAFAADVGQAVAGVRELTGSARELAGTAKEAADGVGSLAEPAGAAADAVKGVAASAGEADKALIGSRDAAAAASGGYERLAGAARGAAAAQKDVAARSAESAAAQEGSAAKADASAGAFAGLASKAALAALGVGVLSGVSVAMAARFQDATTHLVTDAGESAANLKMVQQGILQVSAATGQGALEITNAMYHVESSGFHGAQGLSVLRVAAEGARVGGADLDTVGKALTGTMNAYGMSSANAATQTRLSVVMMNELIAAVGAGDMRMQDLASSLGNVAPVAAAAKVSFADVGGALATMTAQNMTAQQATQDLRHTILSLESPNKVAQKEMAGLGLSAADLSSHLGKRGLAATIEMVTEAARAHAGALGQTYTQAMYKAMGGTTGLTVALMLSGTRMSAFRANIATVAAAAEHGGSTVANWAAIQGTFAFQLDKAKTSAEAVAISFGLALLPAATRVMGVLASLGQWMARNTWAAIALAAVISGLLTVVIGGKFINALRDGVEAFRMLAETEFLQEAAATAAAAGTWLLNAALDAMPIIMIIAGLAALAAGFWYLWTHFAGFRDFFIAAWHDIEDATDVAREAIMDAVRWIVSAFDSVKRALGEAVSWAAAHWKLLVAIILGPLGLIIDALATHWGAVKHGFEDAWRFVSGIVGSEVAFLRNDVIGPYMRWTEMVFRVGWAAVKAVFKAVWEFIRPFVDLEVRGVRIALSWFERLGELFGKWWWDAAMAEFRMIEKLVGFAATIPGRVNSALGGLPMMMFRAGVHAIEYLINGILSQVGSLGSTMGGIAGKVAGFFGLSPAKEGPLSGGGAPFIRGQHFAADIASGMLTGLPGVRQAAAQMAQMAAMIRAAQTAGAGGAPGTAAAGAAGYGGYGGAVGYGGGSHATVNITANFTAGAQGLNDPRFLQYIQTVVQEATLRYQLVNPGNGLSAAGRL